MRVFDNYCYNIIGIVKFNKTKAYIDKMLSELGLAYSRVCFSLRCGRVDETLKKFPGLTKYCRTEDKTRDPAEYGNRVITSISDKWYEGSLYAAKDDIPAVNEIFSKIPRTYDFTFAVLMLDGIDWYGEGTLPATAVKAEPWREWDKIPPALYATGSSGIFMERSFGDGNKKNTLWVKVEATADGEPRDTEDVTERLAPYLGKPLFCNRRCFYTQEEYDRFAILEKQFSSELEELFRAHVSEGKHAFTDIMGDSMVKDLCGKRRVEKIFKNNGIDAHFGDSGMPGAITFSFYDSHRFSYSMLVDRSPSSNVISFRFSVSSCNFCASLRDKSFCLKTKEEADEKVGELARYVALVRDTVSGRLADAFDDCPAWFNK